MVIVEHTTIVVVNMGEYHTEESEAENDRSAEVQTSKSGYQRHS